jgi:hypothetical protein
MTVQPIKKLAPKLYGPFRIFARIGKSTDWLVLQSHWWIHNIFYTSLLEHDRNNAIEGWSQILPEPEGIDGEMESEVEWIL